MTHTHAAPREGSLNPQQPRRWATLRKAATWRLKWCGHLATEPNTAISGQAASHF
jgi:hypothetical protein